MLALGVVLMVSPALEEAFGQTKRKRSIIRDAEIEALLRDYSEPVFRAAGLAPSAVDVIIVRDSGINAFVTGGQKIFIHTGLLTEADTANEVIGVIAHEAGHIAGGHLARSRDELERASVASIVAQIAGMAAAAGGALAGSNEIGQLGTGIARGGQEVARRTFLKYARAQEAAADQAAMRYLDATGQSARGMLKLFERLSDQMLVSVRNVDPYVLSHPLPRERIALLRRMAQASPHYNKPDPPQLALRHELMRAKLLAYLGRPNTVFRRYKENNNSLPARYARAITYYRSADLNRALRELDSMIRENPNYPYFWELRGQALLESRRIPEAIESLNRAVELAPKAALIRIILAQALLESGDPRLVDTAISHLQRAVSTEFRSSFAFRQLAFAYDRKGDTGRAKLASARGSLIRGDRTQAQRLAKGAKESLRRGTPEWVQADDILNIKPR